jgi:hypothetical protein
MYFLVKGKLAAILMQINMRLTVAPRKSALSGRDSGGLELCGMLLWKFSKNITALVKVFYCPGWVYVLRMLTAFKSYIQISTAIASSNYPRLCFARVVQLNLHSFFYKG